MFKMTRCLVAVVLSLTLLALSEGFKTQVEKEFAAGFLQMLHMDHAPNVSCDRHNIPRYILNLYKSKFTRNPSDERASEGSTTRILFPQDLIEDGNNIFLQFNLSSVSFNASKILRNAELHIQVYPEAVGTVKVSIVRQGQTQNSRNISDSDKDTIGTRDCHRMNKHRWMVFNLTQVILLELKSGRENVKLSISTTASVRIALKGKRKPFIAVFSKTDEIPSQPSRNALHQYMNNSVTENNGVTYQAQEARNLRRAKRDEPESEICQKRRLSVRIRDLKWNGWIIAPSRFGFHYCDGRCPGTLDQVSNPTNHAIMQNILHHRLGRKVPAATCVPTELHSMSLLYYDVDDTIVLRDVPGMVASNCGCR